MSVLWAGESSQRSSSEPTRQHVGQERRIPGILGRSCGQVTPSQPRTNSEQGFHIVRNFTIFVSRYGQAKRPVVRIRGAEPVTTANPARLSCESTDTLCYRLRKPRVALKYV